MAETGEVLINTQGAASREAHSNSPVLGLSAEQEIVRNETQRRVAVLASIVREGDPEVMRDVGGVLARRLDGSQSQPLDLSDAFPEVKADEIPAVVEKLFDVARTTYENVRQAVSVPFSGGDIFTHGPLNLELQTTVQRNAAAMLLMDSRVDVSTPRGIEEAKKNNCTVCR